MSSYAVSWTSPRTFCGLSANWVLSCRIRKTTIRRPPHSANRVTRLRKDDDGRTNNPQQQVRAGGLAVATGLLWHPFVYTMESYCSSESALRVMIWRVTFAFDMNKLQNRLFIERLIARDVGGSLSNPAIALPTSSLDVTHIGFVAGVFVPNPSHSTSSRPARRSFSNFDVESQIPALMPVSLSSIRFTVATAQIGKQNSCHEYRVDSQGQVFHVRRRKFKQTSKPGTPDPICCWLLAIINRYHSSKIVWE